MGDSAFGVQAAHAGTRIAAFVTDASSIVRAIVIKDAFGSATDVRISVIFFHAFASSGSVSLGTNCVVSAWRRRARIAGCNWSRDDR